jgi:hypothetical protein
MTITVATPRTPTTTRQRKIAAAVVLAPLALTATVAIAATTTPTTPAAQVVSPTSAEQSYLRMTKPTAANTDATLTLGHSACRTMNSGQRTYSEYRLAIGQLMAAGQSPSNARAIVHDALISGLCAEARRD